MKIKLLIILIFLIAGKVFPDAINNLIKKGLDYTYNFNWTAAEENFNKIIKDFPDDPRGYHYLSGIHLWFYLSSNNENDLEQFVQFSDEAIKKGKNILSENPKNETIVYTLGSIYTYRAIAFAKAENYLDAIWASKESESYLTDALELNPENYDAYLGLGLYNFAVGQIPSAFKWALNLAGISGNKEKGIEYIKLASSKGNLSKTEAQYYLSQILTEVIYDYNLAADHLKKLTSKYPSNLLFNYSYAALEIKRRNLDVAEKILNKIIGKNYNNFPQLYAFANFLLGDVHFRRNEFDSAKVYYHKFLDIAPGKDYTGIASLRLGISYELSGDSILAKEFYKSASKGNTDIDDDIYAKRKGDIYLRNGISKVEEDIIRASNIVETGKYQEAYNLLQGLLGSTSSENVKTEIYLYLSEVTYRLQSLNESSMYALAAIQYDGEEKWIKPFAYFYAARANNDLNNIEETKKYLDQAEENNDYDYKNKLKNLIDVLSESLEAS